MKKKILLLLCVVSFQLLFVVSIFGQTLEMPQGFRVQTYTEIHSARQMALADNGVVFVGTENGKIYALVGEPNNTPKKILVYDDLKIGAGVAFADGNLYVSDKNRIFRFSNILKNLGKKKVVSEGNTLFPKGTEVFSNGWGVGENHWGGLAQMACLPEAYLQKIPDALTAKDCMALGTAGYTAMLCVLALLDSGVKPEDGKVAITGATGGVGSFALLFLARLGYEIIAFTGKEEQINTLKEQGASEVMMRKDLEEKAKPLDKTIWKAAIDTVGGNVLANILAKTKDEGVVAICGLTGGAGLQTTVMPFILRGVRLIGVNSVTQPMKNRERAWQKIAELINESDCGNRSETISLKEAQEKAAALLQGKLSKRLVVDCNQ